MAKPAEVFMLFCDNRKERGDVGVCATLASAMSGETGNDGEVADVGDCCGAVRGEEEEGVGGDKGEGDAEEDEDGDHGGGNDEKEEGKGRALEDEGERVEGGIDDEA